MKILVVEDEKKMRFLIRDFLVSEGHEVECATNGNDGLCFAQTMDFDVMLVDVMLPGMDGISMIQRIRKQGIATPVIVVSARGELDHRIEGLDAGADDYLPKPFALSELSARLRAILRRASRSLATSLILDDLIYHPRTREASRAGVKVELSVREALLLETLLIAAGQTVSRMEIIKQVWEYSFDPGTNIVEVYVRRLRDKIDRGKGRKLIHNVRGLGYQMRE